MGWSFPPLGLAALGSACAFDWDGVYGARFGGNAQGGAGARVPMLGDLVPGTTQTVDYLEYAPSSGFVAEGPLSSAVRPSAATARVAIVAGQGVSAYVDSICLTW